MNPEKRPTLPDKIEGLRIAVAGEYMTRDAAIQELLEFADGGLTRVAATQWIDGPDLLGPDAAMSHDGYPPRPDEFADYVRDGTPHRQPPRWRRAWCCWTGGHMIKFDTHPRGSCLRCGWCSWIPSPRVTLRGLLASARQRALHYGALVIPLAYTLGCLTSFIPGLRPPAEIVALIVAMGVIVALTIVLQHDRTTCQRCADQRPCPGKRRLTLQHFQYYLGWVWTLGVAISALLFVSVELTAGYVLLYNVAIVAGLWWAAAWSIHHQRYRDACPRCKGRYGSLGIRIPTSQRKA